MKHLLLTFAALAALCSPLVAFAAADAGPTPADASAEAYHPPAPEPVIDPADEAEAFWRHARSGEWLMAIAAAIMLLVWGARLVGRWAVGLASEKAVKFLDSQLGKYLTSYAITFGVTISMAIKAGGTITAGLIWMAITTGVLAAGGLDHLKDAWALWKNRGAKTAPEPAPE